MGKVLFTLSILGSFFLSSTALSKEPVHKEKLMKVIKLQNQLAKHPDFYNQIVSMFLSEKESQFLSQKLKESKAQTLPQLELVGDTLYFKGDKNIKNQNLRIRLDMKDASRIWIRDQEFVFNSRESLEQNFNRFVLAVNKKKVSFDVSIFSKAVAQNLPTESYTITLSYTYISSWFGFFLKNPGPYTPPHLEAITQEGFFSKSRYCTLDNFEATRVQEAKKENNRNQYFTWLSKGVFPGYKKEMEYIEKNYVADAKKKNPQVFPQGIRSFKDLFGEYEKAQATVSLEDDEAVEKDLGFYNQFLGSMVESDMEYFAHILGILNSDINERVNNLGGLGNCRESPNPMDCFFKNSSQARENKKTRDEIDHLVKQKTCIANLLERRQEFQRAFYINHYCNDATIAKQYPDSVEAKSGRVYGSVLSNCKGAAETKLVQRPMLCRENQSFHLTDAKTNSFSSEPGVRLCSSYLAPLCFSKSTSGQANCDKVQSANNNCLCVPNKGSEERMRAYKQHSGGAR